MCMKAAKISMGSPNKARISVSSFSFEHKYSVFFENKKCLRYECKFELGTSYII